MCVNCVAKESTLSLQIDPCPMWLILVLCDFSLPLFWNFLFSLLLSLCESSWNDQTALNNLVLTINLLLYQAPPDIYIAGLLVCYFILFIQEETTFSPSRSDSLAGWKTLLHFLFYICLSPYGRGTYGRAILWENCMDTCH